MNLGELAAIFLMVAAVVVGIVQIVLCLLLWDLEKHMDWLKNVLIPWMNSIGNAVNPEKK